MSLVLVYFNQNFEGKSQGLVLLLFVFIVLHIHGAARD